MPGSAASRIAQLLPAGTELVGDVASVAGLAEELAKRETSPTPQPHGGVGPTVLTVLDIGLSGSDGTKDFADGVVIVSPREALDEAYRLVSDMHILHEDGFGVRSNDPSSLAPGELNALLAGLPAGFDEDQLPPAVRRRFGSHLTLLAFHEEPKRGLIRSAIQDPNGAYDTLRDAGDIVWDAESRSWYILGRGPANAALRDSRLRARGVPAGVADLPAHELDVILPVELFLAKWMAFSDPPKQTQIRRASAPHLARSVHAQHFLDLRRRVVELVHEQEPTDFLRDIAVPLSRVTTQAMLGVSTGDLESLQIHSAALINYLATPGEDIAAARAALPAIESLRSFVTRLGTEGNPLAHALVELATEDGFDMDDAAAAYAQILTGAMEPLTTALVACAIYGTSRDLLTQTDGVINAVLAQHPPFHFAPRVAREDIVLGGRQIRAGQRVVVNLLAANRDPSATDASSHLSFGSGTHYCLGLGVAREHLRVALPALAQSGLIDAIQKDAVEKTAAFGQTIFSRVPLAGTPR